MPVASGEPAEVSLTLHSNANSNVNFLTFYGSTFGPARRVRDLEGTPGWSPRRLTWSLLTSVPAWWGGGFRRKVQVRRERRIFRRLDKLCGCLRRHEQSLLVAQGIQQQPEGRDL